MKIRFFETGQKSVAILIHNIFIYIDRIVIIRTELLEDGEGGDPLLSTTMLISC